MEESYVKEQLSKPNLKQVSFGVKGNGITYANMMAIKKDLETAKVEGIDFTTSPNRSYPNGRFASSFIGLAQLHENEDGSKSLLWNFWFGEFFEYHSCWYRRNYYL